MVLSGCYKTYETTGIPLEVMFEFMRERDAIPSWIDFHLEAMEAGMKHKRILSMLNPAIVDSYGSEFRDEVLKRLKNWYILIYNK